jgi:hypothetical protein
VSYQIFSDVCKAHNHLIKRRDWMLPDFLQPIISPLLEDCSQYGTGPNGPGFSGWSWKTMYYSYTMTFFDKTPKDKYEAEIISVDYIIFFRFFKLFLFVWCHISISLGQKAQCYMEKG